MKNQNSLKWIIKNSKGEIPKIFILSISNIFIKCGVFALQKLDYF